MSFHCSRLCYEPADLDSVRSAFEEELAWSRTWTHDVIDPIKRSRQLVWGKGTTPTLVFAELGWHHISNRALVTTALQQHALLHVASHSTGRWQTRDTASKLCAQEPIWLASLGYHFQEERFSRRRRIILCLCDTFRLNEVDNSFSQLGFEDVTRASFHGLHLSGGEHFSSTTHPHPQKIAPAAESSSNTDTDLSCEIQWTHHLEEECGTWWSRVRSPRADRRHSIRNSTGRIVASYIRPSFHPHVLYSPLPTVFDIVPHVIGLLCAADA